jgi:hypothetical protein
MQFSIAPLIYNFLKFYISFANPKNFGLLILHQYSRNLKFSKNVAYAV